MLVLFTGCAEGIDLGSLEVLETSLELETPVELEAAVLEGPELELLAEPLVEEGLEVD